MAPESKLLFAVCRVIEKNGVLNNLDVIVPRHFIAEDKNQQTYVKYLKLPHDNETELLTAFIKHNTGSLKAPEDWPYFKCIIKCACGKSIFLYFFMLSNN